jgi:hypothetical protein
VDEKEKEVLAAAERRADALASGNSDRLRNLLHPQFIWTSHKGDVFDRNSYIANNTGGSLRWKTQHLVDPDVRITGNVAVLRALVIDEVERNGEVEAFRMPVTQIWVEQEGVWRCLGGHAGPSLPD